MESRKKICDFFFAKTLTPLLIHGFLSRSGSHHCFILQQLFKNACCKIKRANRTLVPANFRFALLGRVCYYVNTAWFCSESFRSLPIRVRAITVGSSLNHRNSFLPMSFGVASFCLSSHLATFTSFIERAPIPHTIV